MRTCTEQTHTRQRMEKYRGKIAVRRLKNKNSKLNLSIKNKDIDYITRPQFPYNFLQCCPAYVWFIHICQHCWTIMMTCESTANIYIRYPCSCLAQKSEAHFRNISVLYVNKELGSWCLTQTNACCTCSYVVVPTCLHVKTLMEECLKSAEEKENTNPENQTLLF